VLVERSRDLAKNNEIFRAYINNCLRGVVGAEGFRLQMQIKNSDGTLN
jgi:capsid protein